MNDNKRYIKYFYDFVDASGHRHAGVNVYDSVLHWITYVNDYKFTDDDLSHW